MGNSKWSRCILLSSVQLIVPNVLCRGVTESIILESPLSRFVLYIYLHCMAALESYNALIKRRMLMCLIIALRSISDLLVDESNLVHAVSGIIVRVINVQKCQYSLEVVSAVEIGAHPKPMEQAGTGPVLLVIFTGTKPMYRSSPMSFRMSSATISLQLPSSAA